MLPQLLVCRQLGSLWWLGDMGDKGRCMVQPAPETDRMGVCHLWCTPQRVLLLCHKAQAGWLCVAGLGCV